MTAIKRFTWGGGMVAVSSALIAIAAASLFGTGPVRWVLLGWGAAALPGLGAGIVMARRHGKPGPGFVVALGAGILARFVVVLGSLAGALAAGGQAYKPWLLGAVLGYVPMELYEIVWFHRRGRNLAPAR